MLGRIDRFRIGHVGRWGGSERGTTVGGEAREDFLTFLFGRKRCFVGHGFGHEQLSMNEKERAKRRFKKKKKRHLEIGDSNT
jgi:hypothetical protein